MHRVVGRDAAGANERQGVIHRAGGAELIQQAGHVKHLPDRRRQPDEHQASVTLPQPLFRPEERPQAHT